MSSASAPVPESTSTQADVLTTPSPTRLVSIDVFRGWVMFMMLAHVLAFCRIAKAKPDGGVWELLCHHWSHVPWRGLTLHDLIQPGFSFLVGTALAFSIAGRRRRGQSDWGLIGHAAWRSVVLVLLGVFLRSLGRDETNWTFEDTLSQIGLGYLPLVLIALAPGWVTPVAIGVILVGYWFAFAIHPLPPADFDYAAVGVAESWPHLQEGFAAHWNKNSNLAWRFDTWFLNLFPRAAPFTHNAGGYATLSFIPTLATMLLGLVAGRWLRADRDTRWTLSRFSLLAVVGMAAGYLLDITGICPSVKRIWTPSWALISGAWCFAILGLLHAVCDRAGYRRWAYPLVILGMNSIVAYVMDWTLPGFLTDNLSRHLGSGWDETLGGETFAPLVSGTAVLGLIWLTLWWMHRHKIYIKI